jgi:hypothetical protein
MWYAGIDWANDHHDADAALMKRGVKPVQFVSIIIRKDLPS